MITVYGAGNTIEELRAQEVTVPANAGRRFKGIQHGELADALRDEINTRGWKIAKELYSMQKDGASCAGAMMITGFKGVDIPGMSLGLGFLNANTRRKALQLTVGTHVACCNNGMITGNIIMRRPHDHTVELFDEVDEALDRYAIAALDIPKKVEELRQRELARGEAANILLEAGHKKLVGWAAIGRVDEEYRKPTFAEHGKDTSWALLNAFTYAARDNIAPTRQMDIYNAFREMLPVAEVAA